MLTTKELLRNAVSRAPLVTLHALTANLTVTNDTTGGDTTSSELEVGVQGPDVRPPNFTTVVIEEEEEEVVEIAVEQASATEAAHSEGMICSFALLFAFKFQSSFLFKPLLFTHCVLLSIVNSCVCSAASFIDCSCSCGSNHTRGHHDRR